jgi:hypothetical protein
MKDLIKKILKENEDEFEWAHDLDPSDAESDIKQFFLAVEDEYVFGGEDLYKMIIEAGARDLMKIKAIGEFVYDETQAVRDRGYDDGRDDCDCDGCCDDFVHYDTHEEEKEQAREEGYEDGKQEGIEEGRAESESEIEDLQVEIVELKERIEELENQLNENINKKNIKRI